MSIAVEAVISVLLVIGGLFILVGSIGLIRLKDFYTRLHAPTKATTVGLGSILISSMIYVFFTQGYISINELLISLFLIITAPVVAHMLAKVAMHYQVKMMPDTKNQHYIKTARKQQPPQKEESAE